MVFLFKKKSRGKQYWFAAKNKRVKGKVVRAWETYVGTTETILAMKRQVSGRPLVTEVKTFEFGISAALLTICERLQLRNITNQCTSKKRDQGIDVGAYLLIMAINRCVDPKSKRMLGDWFEKSFLCRHLGLSGERMTSQRFWDHMNYFSSEVIEKIEKMLTSRLFEEFELELDCLLYDPTNFATYINHHPDRENKIPQRGKSKQKRNDLLLVNLALLVTRKYGIPLLHDVYQGNINDSTEFKVILKELLEWCENFQQQSPDTRCDLTLIFDKGNNSKDALSLIEGSPYHFVGSLRPSTQTALLMLPLEEFEETWVDARKRVTKAHRLQKKIYKVRRTLVVTYHEPSANKAKQTLEIHLTKAELKLRALEGEISPRIHKIQAIVETKAQVIVTKKRINGLLTVTIRKHLGAPYLTLSWQRDTEAIQKLHDAYHKKPTQKATNSLETYLTKAEAKLRALQEEIGQRVHKIRVTIEKNAQSIVGAEKVEGLLSVAIQEQSNEPYPTLSWQRDTEKIQEYQKPFGKTILFTDRNEWTTAEIIAAYRSQYRVEHDFRELKNPDHIRATPAFHWTDQKLIVHLFVCVMSLLIQRLLHREVHRAGLDWSLGCIYENLATIEEVVIQHAGVSSPQYVISKLSHDQKRLFTALQLKKYCKNANDSPTETSEVI